METQVTILKEALSGVARVSVRGRNIEIELSNGGKAQFRVESHPGEVEGDRERLLFLQAADPRTLLALRGEGVSFVTASGYVFLTAPGIYVDIRPRRPVGDPDRLRNPFSPRGRSACVALLQEPERLWSVRDLAAVASSSESFISRVVAGLEEQGLVTTKGDGIRVHADVLFVALGEHWPRPTAFYTGRQPRAGEAAIGGGPAYEQLGLAVPALPRAYVATKEQLRELGLRTKSTPATSNTAEWEAVLQPLPLPDQLVPALVCALELARDPRGREVLRHHELVPWPIL